LDKRLKLRNELRTHWLPAAKPEFCWNLFINHNLAFTRTKEANMKLKQISVPIENAYSRLYKVTRALGENGVRPRALMLADTGHFGELRVLVSDTTKARRILMQKDLPGRVDDVVAVRLEDKPEELPNLLVKLMEAGIKIKYSYALAATDPGTTTMVFHFDDNDRALKVLGRIEGRIVNPEAIDQPQLIEPLNPGHRCST
jgi:hypothetical protein